jgi:hypothetical protein
MLARDDFHCLYFNPNRSLGRLTVRFGFDFGAKIAILLFIDNKINRNLHFVVYDLVDEANLLLLDYLSAVNYVDAFLQACETAAKQVIDR